MSAASESTMRIMSGSVTENWAQLRGATYLLVQHIYGSLNIQNVSNIWKLWKKLLG